MGLTDDERVRLLADELNRAVVATVATASGPLSIDEVLSRVLEDQVEAGKTPADGTREALEIQLHHVVLPRLADATLLEYDPTENHVSAVPQSPVGDVLESDSIAALEALCQTDIGGEDRSVEFLDGSAAIYDRARSIADEAAEELFLIYADADLLDAACLPHAEGAIDRGVDIYAGATCPDAREFFSECLPAATVWEPQLDWLYEEASTPKISRLVVADRETVVVGLWTTDSGERREVGMAGDGEDNPLVVLVRELLGSRLDHLDYQSDDLLESLPFD